MDNIRDLPDDLLPRILSRILSSLNTTKDVITTSLLSKRWCSLWTLVLVLGYDDRNHRGDYKLFTQFVHGSFLLNKAPVLEHLHLSLGSNYSSVDIGLMINVAVTRHVRELYIEIRSSDNGPMTLPSCLYTSKTLQKLTLIKFVSLDVPVHVRLPSLKTLSLKFVTYADNKSLTRLLSGCPNLEDLSVEHCLEDRPMDVIVAMPSLRRLHMFHNKTRGTYVLNVPSLEYLKCSGVASSNLVQIENMPELVHARVTFCGATHNFLKSLTSVRRLTLMIPVPKVMNTSGMIFNQLVHLELYTFREGWWDLLIFMLQNSPKLRFLKLIRKRGTNIFSDHNIIIPTGWKLPSSVPECLLHSLEALEWFGYKGRKGDQENYGGREYKEKQGDRKVAAYVLKNATFLKRATFSPKSTNLEQRERMRKELATVATASASCQIRFK